MTPDRHPEKRGGRWPHVVHRFRQEDQKIAEYESEFGLTPIKPLVLPKITPGGQSEKTEAPKDKS